MNMRIFFGLFAYTVNVTISTFLHVIVVYPLLPAYWEESPSVALWGFAASFSRQSSSMQGCYAGGIPPQIQGRQCGAYLWAAEEMLCGMFVSATKGAEW